MKQKTFFIIFIRLSLNKLVFLFFGRWESPTLNSLSNSAATQAVQKDLNQTTNADWNFYKILLPLKSGFSAFILHYVLWKRWSTSMGKPLMKLFRPFNEFENLWTLRTSCIKICYPNMAYVWFIWNGKVIFISKNSVWWFQ